MTMQKIKKRVEFLQKALFFKFSTFFEKKKPYVPLDKTLYLLDYVVSDDTVFLASRVFLLKHKVFFFNRSRACFRYIMQRNIKLEAARYVISGSLLAYT